MATGAALVFILFAGISSIESALKERVRHNPEDFEANHNLGEFYVQQHKLALAIPYLEKGYRLNPLDYVNGYDLALAYLETKNLRKARAHLLEMLEAKDTAELHNLLAEAENKLGNSGAAAKQYQRAAELEPSEKHIFDWGNHLLAHGAYEPALQVFRFGIERYPQSSKLRVGLGVGLYYTREYDQAVEALCSAVDLDPADTRPLYFLGKMHDVSPRMADAVTEHLAGFVQRYPKNAMANYFYALSLWKRTEENASPAALDRIESLLKTAIKLAPDLEDAHFQLALLHETAGRTEIAIREYQQVLKLDANHEKSHYRLARLYARTGRNDLASQHLAVYRKLHKQSGERAK